MNLLVDAEIAEVVVVVVVVLREGRGGCETKAYTSISSVKN